MTNEYKDEDLSQKLVVAWSELDRDSRSRFLRAYRSFTLVWPDSAHLPIGFFLLPRSEDFSLLWSFPGEGTEQYREIWIRAVSPSRLPPEHVILRGLISCGRRCKMGCGQLEHQTIQLRQADRDLARLASLLSDSMSSPGVLSAPRFVARISQVK